VIETREVAEPNGERGLGIDAEASQRADKERLSGAAATLSSIRPRRRGCLAAPRGRPIRVQPQKKGNRSRTAAPRAYVDSVHLRKKVSVTARRQGIPAHASWQGTTSS
jgi:hypothetical protein